MAALRYRETLCDRLALKDGHIPIPGTWEDFIVALGKKMPIS